MVKKKQGVLVMMVVALLLLQSGFPHHCFLCSFGVVDVLLFP